MDQEELLEIAEQDLRVEADKRRFIYKDVEEIITHDFLTHTIELSGNIIVLRSSLPKDYQCLEHLESLPSLSYLHWTISHHVYMINGFIVSSEKLDNHAFQIYQDTISNFSLQITEVLFYTIQGLKNRVTRALRLVEAFCYEGYSRTYWSMIKGARDWRNTSVVSRVWRSYNQNEDLRKGEDFQWEHTKIIAGSMSKKAFDQIGKFIKDGRTREKQQKQKVIEDAVNWVFYGEEPEKIKQKQPRKVVLDGKEYEVPTSKGAQSVEEMLGEMKKVIQGEKDFHDTLVDNYHEGIRKRREQIREERRRVLEEAIARRSEEEITGGTIIAGYTKEQLEELNMTREKKTGQVRDEKEGYLFERYFKPEVVPGVLGKSGPERANSSNTSKKVPSLQERVSSRSPTFKKNK